MVIAATAAVITHRPPKEVVSRPVCCQIAELHLHLEGTLEPETIFAIAERNKINPPYHDLDELRSRYAFSDLQSFLDLCYSNVAVLRVAEDFADMTTAYLDRARDAGVRHAEVFLNPQAHTSRGVPLRAVMEGVTGVLSESLRSHNLSSGLMVAFLRDETEEWAMETLEAVLAVDVPFVGVGLDSAEVGHPPAKFEAVFERARAEGLHVSLTRARRARPATSGRHSTCWMSTGSTMEIGASRMTNSSDGSWRIKCR